MDVNPSIELKIDSNNRVIKVVANNADAETILQSMDITGSTLDTAVYASIGSMTTHGYLTDATNSVLVSVDTKKEDWYNQIIEAVTSKIEVTFQTSTHRYEIELAKNGRIVSVERKPLKDAMAYLPEEEIKQIAMEKVYEINPSLRDEKYTVTVECELDDGVYEVEVKVTYFIFTYEYELKINPTTGNVIRIKLG